MKWISIKLLLNGVEIMSEKATPESVTVKLMQERLEGAENDTKDLAKMLLDLGISPTSPNLFDIQSPEFQLASDPDLKSKRKAVHFGSNSKKTQKSSNQLPILKKSVIKPLQVNLNSLNHEIGDGKTVSKSLDNYSKLISRLCKTESVIQSLKLSLCNLKASHETSDREKNLVLERLKEEINEQEAVIKKQEEQIVEEQKRSKEHTRRWEEAEKEVKELHHRLQMQASIVKESSCGEEFLREKFNRKLEEAKQELNREKEVRAALEDSHQALISRVEDMEDTLEHERGNNDSLRNENKKLRETNESLKNETKSFHSKAEDLSKRLASLTEELQTKEKAIRRLIEEQQQFQTSNSTIANEQATLNKELNQCNIVLEVQKAAFSQLEQENEKLRQKLEEARIQALEREEEDTRKKEEVEIKKNEEKSSRKQFEERLKAEMNLAIKNEKKQFRELEERNKLLEECVKEQERVINTKEQEHIEREKENDDKLFEERKKTARFMKETEQAVKAKENLIKDLNRASSDVNRDKELLQQQLEELKLEQEVLRKERDHQEEENQRLLNRIGGVEQQEQAFKRAQDLLQSSNNAKNHLAYENGKLQSRLEQLEDELREMASVQSQLLQLRAANRAFEQKYAQVTSELANIKIEYQRAEAHVKQLQSGLSRKEDDFNLAISARDEAVREKEVVAAQIDILKDQEKNKVSLLKRDLYDCRHDNERLTATLNDVTTRHSEVQDTLNSVQAQLGRKDSLLANLQDERKKMEREVTELSNTVARLQSSLDQRDLDEQSRISPALEALERAREENIRLTRSLEDVLKKNDLLKEDLEKNKTDLDIQKERVALLLQQQESNEKELAATSQTHSDRLQQIKDQFARERTAIKKQLQLQISEMKKANETSQARNSQLTKGNTDLRSKLADQEQTLEKLKAKLKQQKSSLDRYHREKKTENDRAQKIKAIDQDIKELEKSKQSYIEKNKQQQQVIATFNKEVASLKDDITALSEAHLVARERNKTLENQVEKEKTEKHVIIDKMKVLEEAMKQAIKDKRNAEEKLRKVEIESDHVQENLEEALAWFKEKFESLQKELSKRKR